MARAVPTDRLDQIAEAALKAFSEKGFRLTQVADVARLAGVAPGTIYLSARSKEDLFWLALRLSMGQPLEGEAGKAPTAEDLRQKFAPDGLSLSLRSFLNDPNAELPSLETVVREHYATVERAAPAIKLVERCAHDWPELAEAFYFGLRQAVIRDLAEYLERGAVAGICRAAPDPPIAARLIVETIAWFAMHRRGDADGRYMDDVAARQATIDALIHAYGPRPTQENP